METESSSTFLEALFPRPQRSHVRSPRRLKREDKDDEAGGVLVHGLKQYHVERDPFTNERGFHSHASHHLLAVYALGAKSPTLNRVAVQHEKQTRPSKHSPGNITQENFRAHLGNRSWYHAYLRFFSEEVLRRGSAETVETYVFSPEANVENDDESEREEHEKRVRPPPRMLNRLHSRLFHPLIHLGYGLEFEIPGLVAEGLAQAAVHPLEVLDYVSPERYRTPEDEFTLTLAQRNSRPSILTILGRIQADDSLSPGALVLTTQADPTNGFDYYCQVGGLRCEALASHTQDWEVDARDVQEVSRAIEELSFLSTLLYGVCGWDAHRGRQMSPNFKADFYLMHVLTSSLFLPAYAAALRPSSISLLLKTYLLSCLLWWVARGRPKLPIHEFYSNTSVSASGRQFPVVNMDEWEPVIHDTIAHPDDHLCKVQRALLYFASAYGNRQAGSFSAYANAGPGIGGQELVDGTIFWRVAQLTAETFGNKDGAPIGTWDLRGFFPA